MFYLSLRKPIIPDTGKPEAEPSGGDYDTGFRDLRCPLREYTIPSTPQHYETCVTFYQVNTLANQITLNSKGYWLRRYSHRRCSLQHSRPHQRRRQNHSRRRPLRQVRPSLPRRTRRLLPLQPARAAPRLGAGVPGHDREQPGSACADGDLCQARVPQPDRGTGRFYAELGQAVADVEIGPGHHV